MFEDSAMKAVFVGASVLVLLTVFGLVMLYYGQARNLASKTAIMSIDTFYSVDIENALVAYKNDNKLITGDQIKNMVNYYYESDIVSISVDKIILLNQTELSSKTRNINNSKESEFDFDSVMYKNILYNINPISEYRLEIGTEPTSGITNYSFTLKK